MFSPIKTKGIVEECGMGETFLDSPGHFHITEESALKACRVEQSTLVLNYVL